MKKTIIICIFVTIGLTSCVVHESEFNGYVFGYEISCQTYSSINYTSVAARTASFYWQWMASSSDSERYTLEDTYFSYNKVRNYGDTLIISDFAIIYPLADSTIERKCMVAPYIQLTNSDLYFTVDATNQDSLTILGYATDHSLILTQSMVLDKENVYTISGNGSQIGLCKLYPLTNTSYTIEEPLKAIYNNQPISWFKNESQISSGKIMISSYKGTILMDNDEVYIEFKPSRIYVGFHNSNTAYGYLNINNTANCSTYYY